MYCMYLNIYAVMPLSRSLSISDGISSGPAALLDFELCIAFSISSLVIEGL